jgi:leader peptidase (prepilin peptidase)/N-methyltransferase
LTYALKNRQNIYALNIILAVIFVLLGLLVGSFLNVVIDRLPAGQSLAYPPSHCPACKKRLAAKDLLPILSYALLKGRCRYCGERISLRLPMVEASTAIAFGLLFAYFKLSPGLAVAMFYFCLLLVIAVIDLERQLIMNWLVYPAAIIAFIISIVGTEQGFSQGMVHVWGHLVVPRISQAGIGLAIGLVLFLLIAVWSRGGMGLGDVKMAALMGIMIGYPSVLVAIFLAIVAGGLTAIGLLATRKKGRKQAIPFGPFLALGAMLALLWGNTIWGWYTGRF